ncbi:uncharacterized protein L203_105401 [Cryptococcus depauperatus CBS 7841]|uniref:Transcription factor CBF/NF-Y/archaeal histone domain-containing protein n=1 Tax=Cryptococcus depauperatus CBS 7841 TaxID=1295531 RepID=A0AAJ8M326_9TREE
MPPAKSNKFKTSRASFQLIKRIMQLDEEVGKLAGATPVMISKSLECFIQVLLDESCKEARAGGSRKLTAGHLKHMINTNPSFDFLREIVDSIPDLPEPKSSSGSSRARKTSAPSGPSAQDGNEDDEAPKTKKGGRKKERLEKERGDEAEGWNKNEQTLPGGVSAPGWAPGGQPFVGQTAVPAQPESKGNPVIGSWKKDMTGGGGTGEDGRGMFDDYEEDEDDY